MNRYDALEALNPQQWLAAAEQHRINLVEDFHRRERIDLPNAQIHAVVHVIVENQIALAEDVPVRTLKRLQQEGLDRHDAIHAMAMVMMEYLPGILTADPTNTAGIGDPGKSYFEALEKLTADSWRHSMDDEENWHTHRRHGVSVSSGVKEDRQMSKSSTTMTKAALLPNPTPGDILLEEFLKPMELSQSALARAVRVSPRRINEIVLGKRAITADTDLRLARYFGMSEGFFLGLQADYDLMQRRREISTELKTIAPRAA